MRRKRRKAIKAMSWQPNISNPFRGIIVWPEPEPVDITVTLYKDSKPDSEFEDKEWTFVIEDESQTGRRKPIATGVINMADYVSTESRTFDITLTLKVASKKLVSASLDLNLSCVLIKEGMATDDDMISIGSMMSLNDTADFNLDDDDDMEVAPSPRLRHKRNLSSGNVKFSPAAKLKEQTDSKVTSSLSTSPLGGKVKKTDRIRSKSALGENVKAIVSEAQRKQDALKRLSTGSDISSEISDNGQDVSNDKSKMEAELIKWTRSRTKGYRGVKVKNMTTSWRDGLAFCAILHSFHPDRIDFSSLDPSNIKDNCKLAFSAFEKLGIPRLLDPTQMMFSPVPDKLSVMTYVFQIKTHFIKTPVPQPSPFNLRKPVPRSRPAPPPPQASREAPADSGKGNVANSSSDTGNGGDSKETNGSKEPYNPFLEDTADVEMDASPEGSSSPATKRSDAGDSKSSEKELISGSSDSSPESKLSMLEETSKELESNVKKEAKPPPKPPRLQQGTDSPVVDTKTKPSGSVDKKEKSVSKALFNPFDAEDNEESSPVPLKTRKPPEGYNPFDEDNSFDSQENSGSSKGRKVGSNPFDEADDNDVVTESTKAADQNVEKKEKQQRKVSYPHSFNPFGDDDDIESKGIEEKEESSSKGYNPFDDDNDNEGEGVSNNATPVKRLPRKSSLQNKEKGNQSPQTGRASPSGGLKQPVKNVKKRQAPPPPAVKSSDDPWTARLPDEVMARRRRPTRPNTPGAAEQPSPHTSPARSGPKRSVPTPPRRPPLIPSFDEWKGDRGVAGDNERPAASQSSENLSNKTNSSEEVDESRKTSSPSPDTSARRSPKVSSGDGPNQADIKLLARQVLMDARKKAGASGALPRERVAEITKTKGPTSNALGAQDKDNKSDNQEALKKKESLRLRREELQRKKKVNEKAQKLVQNAIGKEMGQKLAESSSEQLITEKQTKDVDAETSDTNTEQKTVKNKNLQHRPLKLKDKENESKKQRPSVEKDGNTSPDKPGFQESEELQRIRQILNQGKKSKKPSDSENIEQQNGKINPQKSDSSKERNIFDSKSSTKNATVNGFSKSTTPSAPLRSNTLAPNAGLHAYIESRKINFEVFEVPADQSQSDGQEVAENDTNSCIENRVHGTSEPNSDQTSSDPEETQTREFQDTSEYVRQELRSLEEQQEALDKVGEKLEMELRRAMECRGCEEEQEKLMQDWFLLVNKKNELVRRQAELNLLKNEEDLEKSHDMLQRELRALLEMEDSQKTNEQREREAELMEQLLSVVNKRDQLVQFEDSQLQQAEKDALHVQKVIANARIPRDRSDCVLQ